MNILDEYIYAAYKSRHIEQGSHDWEMIRLGRFTASEIYKIMECGKRKMTEDELKVRPKKGVGSKTTLVPDPSTMSDTGLKYIRVKVWETLTGTSLPDAYAYPLVYGKEHEPEAVEFFENKYGLTTYPVGFQCWSDHAGCSPDRMISEKEGLEIKCPCSEEQINYLMLNDHYDLFREYPKYYWQCVSSMLFTGAERWNFCTYDFRLKDDNLKMTRIIINLCDIEEHIDMLVKALEGAINEKLKLINLITK